MVEYFRFLTPEDLFKGRKKDEIERIKKTILCFDDLKLLGMCARGGKEILKFVEIGKKKGFVRTSFSFTKESIKKGKLPEGYYFAEPIFRFEGPDGHFLTVPIRAEHSFCFPTVNEFQKMFTGKEVSEDNNGLKKIPGELIKDINCYLITDKAGNQEVQIENIFSLPYGINDKEYYSLEINILSNEPIMVHLGDEFKGLWLGGLFYDFESLKELNMHRPPQYSEMINDLISTVAG